MTTWASGYVADLPYISSYYRELSPAHLYFAATSAAVEAPHPERKLAYCELGCGYGLTANVIAAANPHIDVHAMDFNPTHIAAAKTLAAEGGLSNAHFYDDSFAEFLQRPDLPAFDIIVLHGVFSWVSPGHRAEIVALIRGKLAAGGLVYISYNAMPGAGALIPLRRLMYEHAERASGSRLARIEQALAFAETVRQVGGRAFAANSAIGSRLDQTKSQPRAYLAHEYFNRHWNPLYHSEVVAELAEAKVDYAGSAHLNARLDDLMLPPSQTTLLSSIEDPGLKETTRDTILNTEFRKDLFVRGLLPMPPQKLTDIWLETRFLLKVQRADVPKSVTVNPGKIDLNPRIYDPIADALVEGPCTLRELFARPQIRNLGFADVRQALYVLVAFGQVDPCLSAAGDVQRALSTRAFNDALMKRAAYSSDLTTLASPVTGGGVSLNRFAQLMVSAWQRKEADIGAAIWAVLKPQGVKPIKDGRTLEAEEEILAEFRQQAEEFKSTSIALLTQLGII